ncbi:MAG: hypothetical protein Q9179_004048 [Wetmoreana sp. 5 TL-2023]
MNSRAQVQGYYDLAVYARRQLQALKARDPSEKTTQTKTLWTNRLQDLSYRIGNALIEMDDIAAAKRHFASLVVHQHPHTSTNAEDENEKGMLELWIAMLSLKMGDLDSARKWLEEGTQQPSHEGVPEPKWNRVKDGLLKPFLSITDGHFDDAASAWRDRAIGDEDYDGVLARQNQAVCLLYAGKLSESTSILQSLVDEGHAFRALTFNLATVYELQTEAARQRKGAPMGKGK